eukprot:scaffold351997_cov71-Attheya_sp.AAC.1
MNENGKKEHTNETFLSFNQASKTKRFCRLIKQVDNETFLTFNHPAKLMLSYVIQLTLLLRICFDEVRDCPLQDGMVRALPTRKALNNENETVMVIAF